MLYSMTKFLLIYVAFVLFSALMAAYVYGLNSVQGQMVLIFAIVAGVPGTFKIARGK
jgi:hypothetical protein